MNCRCADEAVGAIGHGDDENRWGGTNDSTENGMIGPAADATVATKPKRCCPASPLRSRSGVTVAVGTSALVQ